MYVLDTGIRSTHQEFGFAPPPDGGAAAPAGRSRVGRGFNAVQEGASTEDCHGHGTHVAAIVGGLTYGVAKNVTLHPVKASVCLCVGSALTTEWPCCLCHTQGACCSNFRVVRSSSRQTTEHMLVQRHTIHPCRSWTATGAPWCPRCSRWGEGAAVRRLVVHLA